MSHPLELQNLTTGYHERGYSKVIARTLNATLEQGKLTCLLGVNGSGKSTLLRTLAGFIAPLEGSVLLCGKPTTSYSPAARAKAVSVVLTERTPIRHMKVRELVQLGRSPYTGFWGELNEHDQQLVSEALRKTGIEALSERDIDTLSDGERQKAMIAKALVQDTPLILLDEPTAFLDFPSKIETMQLLRKLASETQKTILLSTHDLEMALQLSDYVWLLKRDDGLTVGTPTQLSKGGHFDHFFSQSGISYDPHTRQYRMEEK